MWREGEGKRPGGLESPISNALIASFAKPTTQKWDFRPAVGHARARPSDQVVRQTIRNNDQECGAIVARSNGNSGKSITGNRSLLRSNSIRRSAALDRIIGKRSNTWSRMLR